ncbi:MAG: RsmG family class I SAM-dependent methyltransferase [Candidatus Fermentibacteraceae bacterium]
MKHIPSGAIQDIAALGVTADGSVIDRLGEFAGLLEKAMGGRFGNLLGPMEMGRLWNRHILESVAYIPLLKKDVPVVDIGSGAGFPGIVLALFGLEATLVESRRKRFLFLVWVRETMKLGNVRVLNGRVEDCGPFPGPVSFTARAVENPHSLVQKISDTSREDFSLTVRTGETYSFPGVEVVKKLPSPPLDRPGFMVQFRHPGAVVHRGNGGT